MEKVCQNFYWPHMSETTKKYVDSCLSCQQKAGALVKNRVPISVIPRDPVPFSHLYMDIIRPLFDSHTRFPFAFPLRSPTAKAVCDCLLQVFSLIDASTVILLTRELALPQTLPNSL